ncbi:TPA: prepilin-type N-terminal cleavage/methylation domain-containing protein [Escherichia coli]|nr:prepilin-type N-terminal cleavage/methylation domain-containing protein [Escherichia coli]HAJ7232205.1 prepilin-type N-terminal cleavage/methylation domain-containing protein [Escherichia coli]
MKMKGFTLLEMIITLAIMGVAMLSVIKYKEKEANEARRQIVSNALITEISGMLKFITEERIIVKQQDGEEVEIINPLYNSGEPKRPYTNRTTNKDLNEDMSSKTDEIIEWREAREYFIRKTCKSTVGQSEYEFTTDYIPCNEPSVLNNSELRLERIDFVGKDDSVGSVIERVDFVLYFDKISDSETFHFTNYIKYLEKAAEDHSIIFKDMYIVERSSQSVNGWSLTKVDNEPLTLGKLPENLDKLVKTKNYGLRISIDPNSGVFLRADGRVGTDKLCWNIDSKMAGPCLTADDTGNNLVLTSGLKAEKKEPGICWDMENGTSKLCLTQVAGKDANDEDKSLLKLKDSEGNPATLLANVIVEESSMDEGNNNNKKIYRTIPNTIYRAFGNSNKGDLVIGTPEDYVSDVTTEKGRIELNVQECPVAPDGQKLYPRLSASIASIVADTEDDAGGYNADFSNPASNREGGQLGQLSGAAIQVNKVGDKWYITATMGAFNPADNTTAVYLNPKFLAVNITTWCSSEEQN